MTEPAAPAAAIGAERVPPEPLVVAPQPDAAPSSPPDAAEPGAPEPLVVAPQPDAAPSSPPEAAEPGAPSARTTVRRVRERASYDRDLAHAIIDEALVCHVGVATDDGPVVIPTLHARDGDRLLLHGSAASRLLRTAARGVDVCVAITLIDGLVLARSAFHHSVNYRSVVVFGRARPIDDLAERRAALDRFVETVVPGRTPDVRPPDDKELRSTIVLALPLDEASVKLRTGSPIDEPEDYDLPVWAGVIPLRRVAGLPEPDPAMPDDHLPAPAYARHYRRPAPSPATTERPKDLRG